MKASDIMHPEDAKALQMLRKIKGFESLDGIWLRTSVSWRKHGFHG